MSLENELSPAEEAYFRSGGTDTSGVLAEAGRSSSVASDNADGYSAAERRFFESAGTDVSYDLLREHGQAPQPEPRSFEFQPGVQALVDRAVAASRGETQAERIAHARTSARLDLLQEAIAPPPQPAAEPSRRPELMSDIFGYTGDLGQRLDRLEGQIATGQAQMAEEGRYRASLDDAVRRDPSTLAAYSHLLSSRAAELMAGRFPTATPDQLRQAAMQGHVPPDIRQVIHEEERDIYRSAFAAGRDPAADIVCNAQLRGWRSPQQIAAAQAAHAEQQRRQREADAAARQKEQDEIDERMRRISLRIQYGGDVSKDDRRFYLQHTKNPGLAQMAFR
jgi:hypothetical protein